MFLQNETVAKQSEVPTTEQSPDEKRPTVSLKTTPGKVQIPRRSEKGSLTLGFAQQRLWFLDQLHPGSPLYNFPIAFRLRGRLDREALQYSLNAIMIRHEALRTRFVCVEGSPVQIIDEPLSLKLPVVDLTHIPVAVREIEAQRVVTTEAKRPFNLAQDLMVRALLVELEPEEHLFVVTVHHIATDAWSMGILFRELAAFYEARAAGRTAVIPELPIQYADFAVWQREQLQGAALESQVAYWKKHLAGATAFLGLPTDRPRPAVQTFRGANHTQRLSGIVTDAIKQISRQEGVTPFMTYLAAFKVLLHRYSKQEDILVGCPIAGRSLVETEKSIGFFVNTLVMRTDLAGDPKFVEVLGRVREVAFGAFAHQELPFDKLVEELHPERTTSQVPLIQVMFAFQNSPAQSFNLSGLTTEPVEVGTETAKFDLTLFLEERPEGVTAIWEYNLALFDEATIKRISGHFGNLLAGIAANPGHHVSQIPLLMEAERQQLLVEWNNTRTDYPKQRCVHELFEEQARLTPEAIALTFGERHLTYQELNARANQLAHYLRRSGVQPGKSVGLCLERSLTLVVGLLAILKAGGGYAALDSNLPKERLATMLEDLQSPLLLTQDKLLPVVQRSLALERFPCPPVICLDHDWSEFANESSENPEGVHGATDLAYVSFTSGSTGRPKGVCVPHRAVVRLVRNTNYASFSAADVFLQLAPVSFDASTLEIWGCLLNGGRLVIFPPYTPSITELSSAIQSQRITMMWLTSGLFNQVVEERPECLKSLQQLLTGGEVMSIPHVKKALSFLGEGCRLLNCYGPTENTTFTTYHALSPGFNWDRPVPIGRPVSNTQCYVVDERLQPVPVGVPGELLAGGDGLAMGYLNRPELTAAKFIPHPFSDEPGARLYRTGDLVRYLADGSLEFLGRVDLQVKIRGFRIELGEIESVLGRHAGVEACAVMAREDEPGTKRLVAYVVGQPGSRTSSGELRRFLSESLPEYMLPSAFIFLNGLPLMSNGKVDRHALPAPDHGRPELEIKYVEPGDVLEQELARLWEAVLGVQPIGMEDKFFDLGGHSLLAVRLLARVEKEFGRTLPLAAIFQAPSIAQMARLLRDGGGLAPGSSLVEIQPKGSRPPLFFVHGVGGGMFWGYTNLARSLGQDQPLYALKSRWMDGQEEFDSIEDMAAQYVADIRAFAPTGPYYLGGYCFGGNVAYEMARKLEAQGEKVALLAVLNCAPPNSSYGKLNWSPGFILKFLRNLTYLIARSLKWGPQQRREFLRWKATLLKRRAARMLHLSREAARQLDVDDLVDLSSFPQDQRQLWEIHIRALLKYIPKPYGGRVSLFRSDGHPMFCSYDPKYGWGELASEVEVHVVPGAHESILEEPHVKVLAERLEESVLKVCRPGSASVITPPQRKEGAPEETAPAAKGMETGADYPRDLCVHQLFEQQVRRTPEAVAVTWGGQQLTYAELNDQADRLAHHLQRLGVGADMPVGICLERSLNLMVGLLGILKAGGAYVPLDPTYPRERLRSMLENAQATVMVTQQSLAPILPATSGPVVCLDQPLPADSRDLSPRPNATPGSLAYVIYTSGSTGKPKGVAMEHRPLVNLIWWQLKNSLAGKGDRTLQFASLSFDVSFQEIFSTWCSGGVLVLVEEETRRDANRLAGFLQEQQINRLFLPFVALNQLAESITESTPLSGTLREIVTAGEQLRITSKIATLFERLKKCALHNHYGPSESHVVTAFTLTGEPGSWPALPPIGRPIANTQIYLLDEHLVPVENGEQGELYIGGDCLARGYLHQPALTAERFIADPFHSGPGARLYKTGDLARCLPDGNFEFLGRADQQVKIRGYRIELGEVEAALAQYPGVRECAVTVREDIPSQKRLIAYVVCQPGQRLHFSELRQFLLSKLPDYMVPSACLSLEALPLTPSGKVNRLGLPAPDQARPDLAERYTAPATLMEERLAEIWQEVLNLKQIGVRDDFFELGGHSLIIAQVVSRVREELKFELPSSSLFDAPTIAALAEGIESGRWGEGEVVAPPLLPTQGDGRLPLSFAQQFLWFIDQLEPGSHAYHVPMAMRLEGVLRVDVLERSLNGIVRRHESLRTTIASEDGEPSQVISGGGNAALRQVDLAGNAEVEREGEARRLVNEDARRPFDLVRGPLLRCLLVRLNEREHILAITMHHIISDGWSLGIFLKELNLLYAALATGKPMPALPALPVQYPDFARWQQKWMQGAVLARHIAYWKANLVGAPPSLELPCDHTPPEDGSSGSQETVLLPKPLFESMVSHCRREGVTPFMLLMATLAITLQRWTGQSDMVIGTVVAGRNRREVENLIGCFMNLVPVRTQPSEQQTAREFLVTVKRTVLDAQTHQECPFEKVVEAINPARRLTQNPLYNVALLLQNFPGEILNSEPLKMRLLPVDLQAVLLDLRFIAEETEQGMTVACEYKTGLFEAPSIKHLLNAFVSALETLIQQPETRIAQFAPPQRIAPPAAVVKVRQDQQMLAVAATFTAEPLAESLRFWMKELGVAAKVEFAPYNQVFQQLLDPGSLLMSNVQGLNLVLLRWEDWEQYEGGTGADGLKNGTERLERTVEEFIKSVNTASQRTAVPWLVCLCPAAPTVTANSSRVDLHQRMETRLAAELERLNGVYLVTPQEMSGFYPVVDYHDPRTEELGRVPYTPLFFAALGTMAARKFHALKRPGFKVIVLDCDQTLWTGVCGEDGPKGIRLDPAHLALQEFMRAQSEAGMLLCVNSKNNEEDVATVFDQRREMPLRREHFAGWRVNWKSKSENLKSLAQELRLGLDSFIFIDDNPMECAEVEANCGEVLTLQLPEVPRLIPQFLKHCWAFDHLKLSAEDQQRNTLYKQDQRREQFRSEAPNLGDFLAGLDLKVLIEALSEGQLTRISQLTQRTNQFNFTTRRRTESELQAAWQDGKHEVLTVSVSDRFGDYGLVGTMVSRTAANALEVETFLLSCRVLGRGVEHRMLARLGKMALRKGLDAVDIHFVPSAKNRPAFNFLESVAAQYRRSLNGGYVYRVPAEMAVGLKLDAKAFEAYRPEDRDTTRGVPALAEAGAQWKTRCRQIALEAGDARLILQRIEERSRPRTEAQRTYVAPRTDLEEMLCKIWEELLRVDRVGIMDNFFELGGHSLLAVRLFAELEKQTGRKLPLVTIFQHSTIEQLAATLSQQSPGAWSSVVAIQPHGTKPPLFLIHGAGGDVLWGYANLSAHLGPDQPVYGIKSRALNGATEFASIEEMAAFYVRQVRRFQKTGPYQLGGYCFGGNVAYEMARQFHEQGEEVALVALLDSAPTNGSYEHMKWWRPSFALKFMINGFYWLDDFCHTEARERREFVLRKTRAWRRKVARRLFNTSARPPEVDLEEVIDISKFPEHELRLWRIHLNALAAHVSRPYPGGVTLFRTRGQPLFCSLEADFGWGELVGGGVDIRLVPGSHESIFIEPAVQSLAEHLKACLIEATGTGPVQEALTMV